LQGKTVRSLNPISLTGASVFALDCLVTQIILSVSVSGALGGAALKSSIGMLSAAFM